MKNVTFPAIVATIIEVEGLISDIIEKIIKDREVINDVK